MTPELLAALPVTAWEHIAQWLHRVEQGELWPKAVTWTRVAPLLKDPEDAPPVPSRTRFISVEAVLARCWASVRCRQLAPWLLSCVGKEVIGGVMGRSGQDATTRKEFLRTHAEAEQLPFGEIGFDSSHCFDSLDPQALLCIACRRGLPQSVAEPLSRLIVGGTRCVVWRGWVTEPLGGE